MRPLKENENKTKTIIMQLHWQQLWITKQRESVMMILCFMDAANGIAVVTMLLSKIPLSESCNCGSFPGALSNCSLS